MWSLYSQLSNLSRTGKHWVTESHFLSWATIYLSKKALLPFSRKIHGFIHADTHHANNHHNGSVQNYDLLLQVQYFFIHKKVLHEKICYTSSTQFYLLHQSFWWLLKIQPWNYMTNMARNIEWCIILSNKNKIITAYFKC